MNLDAKEKVFELTCQFIATLKENDHPSKLKNLLFNYVNFKIKQMDDLNLIPLKIYWKKVKEELKLMYY